MAESLGCGEQTVRDATYDFNQRGLDALVARSSRPKRTRDAFDKESTEALREMLHRSPREFGYGSSLWTLDMAADVAEVLRACKEVDPLCKLLWYPPLDARRCPANRAAIQRV